MSSIEKRGIGFQADALLAPHQALSVYFERARMREPQIEFVSIERARERTLAQDAVSDAEYPSAARSAMDGFAVFSADTPGALLAAGEIRMGCAWQRALERGTAIAIPTGGELPDGADAVVPIENVRLENGAVHVAEAAPPGDCVIPAGSDMRAGELLLQRGRRIGPNELAVLATLGIARVPVYRRPHVAVCSSGDELVDVEATPGRGQIRDSNRWAVAGALEALGTQVRHLPTARDDGRSLETILREGLATCDAVVLTGGSSVGERDLTPRIVAKLGRPGVLVHGLRIRPGKPALLASIEGKPVLGLPGNPASALLVLQNVGAPILARLSGATVRSATIDATLGCAYRKRAGWTWYVPVRLDEAERTPEAYPLELRSSSASLLARASGFIVLDEAVEELPAGAPVRVMRFLGS